MRKVAVVGATGYSGAELCALAARHPRVEIAAVFSSGKKEGALPFEKLHPLLGGRKGPGLAPFTVGRLVESGAELAFLATPNETSAEIAPELVSLGIRVIDIAGAFRLRDAGAYPRWYGFDHPSPELLGEAVYGLTEWCGAELGAARLVANPGCYPTSVLLALKPIAGRLAAGQPVICDSVSGVSGAGKRSEVPWSFAELAGNFKAYGVGVHRHEPEMRQGLGLSEEDPFVFVPHLLPAVRGILSTIHVSLAEPATPESLAAAYDGYSETPFVRVRPAGDLPELRDVVGTPRCEIGFVLLPGACRAVVVSVIDNLLKGAASQAIQNMNRMFGFTETEGLL
ncbi:MAG: N-acetyl-gamma-glutamyl-phosphate reductase [Acidithiobacillales bacterium]